MIQRNSLSGRQFYASAILLPVMLSFIAYALDEAFSSAQLSAEKSSLQTQIYLLIGAAEPEDKTLALPNELGEPRYSLPGSGLYATVLDRSGNKQWNSRSLVLSPELPSQVPYHKFLAGQEFFSEFNVNDNKYFYFAYDTIWEVDNEEKQFRFLTIHNASEYLKEIRAYRKTLWEWLGALAVFLIATQFLIVRWGLIPLRRLAAELSRFQKGETTRLEGNYPQEISPVTENLNAVLESEKHQRERYKNTLSDLAHSLKTPLAVIRTETNKSEAGKISAENIDDQISRMADIINHQLQRATTRSTHVLHNTVEVRVIVERLGKALQKVYSEKGIVFSNNVSADALFQGEESDAMELLGNLIENAFKYGESNVQISTHTSRQNIEINIEDDGPGIDDEMKDDILRRGARADTSKQGQGIGLAIAVDIISSYNGGLSVGASRLGGACFTVVLPAP